MKYNKYNMLESNILFVKLLSNGGVTSLLLKKSEKSTLKRLLPMQKKILVCYLKLRLLAVFFESENVSKGMLLCEAAAGLCGVYG